MYEDKKAFPRAWVVHRTIVEPSSDATTLRIDKSGINLHNVAVIAGPLPGIADAASGGDTLRFRSYEATGMSLDVNAASAGLLVLSEVYYPGWQATVNGRESEIRKVDGGLRGLVVPAGQSHVVLEYRPTTAYAGLGLSFATGLAVLLGWIFFRRKSDA